MVAPEGPSKDNPLSDEEIIEQEMRKMQVESEGAAKELQEALGQEDMAALQEAMNNNDHAKIKELTEKLSKKLGDGKAGAGLDKMVKLSLRGFREKSPAELRADLASRFEGSLLGPVIKTFPKLLDFVVNLFQDEQALPKLFSIPKDRKKLYIFIGVNVALFIAAKVYKHIKKGKGALGRWLTFTMLRFGVLFGFFHKELTPMLQVAKKTFF